MTNQRTQPLLSVQRVTKAFGGLVAVNDVSFDIRSGDLISIIGPNGAGKTTLINLITGVHPLTKGQIWFKGNKRLDKIPSHKIAYLGINRTFQDFRIFTNLSVIDNVLVGTHVKGRASLLEFMTRLGRAKKEEKEMYERAVEKLALVGLEKKGDIFPLSLSVRERKLLEIAQCLAAGPELLFLDEPVGGLSLEEIRGMANFIRNLREQGMTIVFIEHRMEMVMDLSDRVIVLNFGGKIAEDTPDRIRENKEVIAAYLGDEKVSV